MADPIVLIDSATDAGDRKTVDVEASSAALYISGLSADTITVQYRPRTKDSFERIHSATTLDSSQDPLDGIFPLPDGEYEVDKGGDTADTLTVMLIPLS